MSAKINPLLTPAAHRLLKQIRDGEDHYAISEGLQVWVDHERFSVRTLYKLLQLCLIKQESRSTFESKTQIWFLNEEGERIIDDARYIPLILTSR